MYVRALSVLLLCAGCVRELPEADFTPVGEGALLGAVSLRLAGGVDVAGDGASVLLVGSHLEAVADSGGRWVIEGVPAGRHALEVSFEHEGSTYTQHVGSVAVLDGSPTTVDVTLQAAGLVRGEVALDPGDEGGDLAPQIFVPGTGYRTLASADGSYALALPSGAHALYAYLPAYAVASREVAVEPAGLTEGADFVLVREAAVSDGTLDEVVAAAPASAGFGGYALLAGALTHAGTSVTFTSEAAGTSAEALTEAQGWYIVPALPVSVYTVTFAHEGYRSVTLEQVLVLEGAEVLGLQQVLLSE